MGARISPPARARRRGLSPFRPRLVRRSPGGHHLRDPPRGADPADDLLGAGRLRLGRGQSLRDAAGQQAHRARRSLPAPAMTGRVLLALLLALAGCAAAPASPEHTGPLLDPPLSPASLGRDLSRGELLTGDYGGGRRTPRGGGGGGGRRPP